MTTTIQSSNPSILEETPTKSAFTSWIHEMLKKNSSNFSSISQRQNYGWAAFGNLSHRAWVSVAVHNNRNPALRRMRRYQVQELKASKRRGIFIIQLTSTK
ncbi:hypothetical protein QG37_04737 [Candidozyma auris]|nr:hypothetical protein QG37_04737 [[Candida] auris]